MQIAMMQLTKIAVGHRQELLAAISSRIRTAFVYEGVQSLLPYLEIHDAALAVRR